MERKVTDFSVQKEFFELRLDVENSSLSTQELIDYLSNADKLIQSVNITLRNKYSIGYDDVKIGVLALEKGSFRIPLLIQKILTDPIITGTLSTLFGGLLLMLFNKNTQSTIVHSENDDVEVKRDDLLSNNSTAEAVGRIARMSVESDRIKSVSITYEKDDGSREMVTLNKETLSESMPPIDEDEKTQYQTSVVLTIVSPVFEPKPSSWRVSYDGCKTFHAKMTDEDFLEAMNLSKIAFAQGDTITADLESVVVLKNNIPKVKHYIRKVHSYPNYIKFNKGTAVEPTLFDGIEGEGD